MSQKGITLSQFQDPTLKKCCEDGMYENPMGYTCEKRAEYVLNQPQCQAVFLECCRYIKSIRDEKERDFELVLGRSKYNLHTHTHTHTHTLSLSHNQ
uniref:Anaphylatoxin-like domain-containing protein n=1 Tax=Salvator merianae TaxID=96440 RepID=A0A8D0B5M8_SALMN